MNRIGVLLLLVAALLQSCDGNSIKRMRARYVFSDFDLERVSEEISTMRVIDSAEVVNISKLKCDDDYIDYKEICDSVFIVPLETTDSCLIAQASKIAVHNDTIYVMDNHQSLMMFAPNGRFIQRISRKGQGPGEYIELTDFFVDDNIYLWDNMQNKLSVFSKKSELLYDKSLPFLAWNIGKVSPNTFVFRSPNHYNLHLPELDDYSVWTTDTCFNVQKRGMYCDFENRIFPYDDNGLTFSGNSVTEYEKFTDSLFLITDKSELKCRYVLNFGNNHHIDELKQMTRKEARNFFNTSNDYAHVLSCFFNNNFIVLHYFTHGKCANVLLYASCTKKMYKINNIIFNNESVLQTISGVCTFYDDFFVQCEDAMFMAGRNQLSKYVGGDISSIKEVDNPVLIFYKFKK